MQVWQDTFKELKEQYMVRSAARMDQIQDLLNELARNPQDIGLLRDLMRQFHWLAGSGGIYGFPQISKLGTHGESFCEELLQEGRPVTRTDWDKCMAMLEAMRTAFSEGDEAQRVTLQREVPKVSEGKADVVIIDTDQSNFLALTRLLEDRGMVLRSCRMGSAGLTAITEHMPKAVIVGMPLPDIDAYQLVEKIRQMEKGNDVVIFTISNQAAFFDKVRAIHCGADGYFAAPVDWDSVVRRLQYQMERNKPSNYKILSIEDDPDQCEFIRAVLQSAGYQVTVISDPQVFEEYMLQINPDLVLLDIMLPGVTGYELARFLRQDDRWATLPIVFLTTENQLYAHIESAKAGGDEHLIKPVPPPLLLQAVASRLERARFIKSLLHRDGLTQLLTHGAFMEAAEQMVALAKRNLDRIAALLIIDVDGLQHINATYGYSAGDRVLVSMSRLLLQRIRQSDTVGRYGGEEFIAIVEDLEEYDAVSLAQRLLQDFAATEHTAPDGTTFTATASAGVAMLEARAMDVEKWRRMAEQALKAAKTAGRNTVQKSTLSRR